MKFSAGDQILVNVLLFVAAVASVNLLFNFLDSKYWKRTWQSIICLFRGHIVCTSSIYSGEKEVSKIEYCCRCSWYETLIDLQEDQPSEGTELV